MEHGRCKLCGEERELCDSHIIPEFFYERLYDDKHRLHEHDRDSGSVNFAQMGYREPLLCEGCEGVLNDRYEKYVKAALYDQGLLPRVPNFTQQTITGLDYRRFKLCMLSILWRASVAKQNAFSRVNLGRQHESAIRDMLLDDEPADEGVYPFVTTVLWLPDSETNTPYIVRGAVHQAVPLDGRYQHKRIYRLTFGGCMWDFLVGSETVLMPTLSIRRDGTLRIFWANYAQVPDVRRFIADYDRASATRPKRHPRRR